MYIYIYIEEFFPLTSTSLLTSRYHELNHLNITNSNI